VYIAPNRCRLPLAGFLAFVGVFGHFRGFLALLPANQLPVNQYLVADGSASMAQGVPNLVEAEKRFNHETHETRERKPGGCLTTCDA
jgi:hypothetical protein